MNAARVLRWARRQALLSQRELAARGGVAQSTVARIEAAKTDPRIGLLSRLLQACGYDLELLPLLGEGVDRAHLRARLQLTPAERLAQVTPMVRSMAGLRGALRQRPAPPEARRRRVQKGRDVGSTTDRSR